MSGYTKTDYIQARQALEIIAIEHPEPGTVKVLCPLCDGGAKKEASLALTTFEEGRGYAWCCHRASCGFSGRSGRRSAVADIPLKRAEFVAKPYPYETARVYGTTVSEYWAAKLRRAFGPLWEELAPRAGITVRAFDEHELVFSNRDWTGRRTGAVSKRVFEDERTVRTWREEPGPVYDWQGPHGQPVWLVEDHLSAARLHLRGGQSAVSLCGTAIPRELVKALAPVLEGQRILVALDPDASEDSLAQALRLRREFGLDAWPVFLTADIKDLPYDEFQTVVRSYA